MILFKKWGKHKAKPYIYCVNQFLGEKCHKNAKNGSKNSLFYSIFVIYFIFWPLELRK